LAAITPAGPKNPVVRERGDADIARFCTGLIISGAAAYTIMDRGTTAKTPCSKEATVAVTDVCHRDTQIL